jgi:hypothetical protein
MFYDVFVAIYFFFDFNSAKGKAVLRIRIRRILMFLGLPDPHPDSLFTNTDPAPDPYIIKQK